uniref:Uncharacterized protein n=1 Tax=Rhizophora mucronata TaxID=61149 RepID=A0A2P2P2N5_RHIMU
MGSAVETLGMRCWEYISKEQQFCSQ